MSSNIVFVKEQYFIDNSAFVEMLDPNDLIKQSTRCYIFISLKYKGNQFYIPLRQHIDLTIGNIGYSLPSSTRPNAGLDFRKALIINNDLYILPLTVVEIASSQMKKITNDIMTIEALFIKYVDGYVKTAVKKRENIDRLYKFSTLHNFHKELGIYKNP
ncbi:MAG: hypothetical protein LBC73_06735 [Oscillospiraceae bacterium]|jgi:protein AbiQ|nr:hypothetical protein [Oscillospiraceae bacterium]